MRTFELSDGRIFRKEVKAIILNENYDTLLVQPCQNEDIAWTFVYGGVEKDETSTEAVKREIFEKIGVQNFISVEKSAICHASELDPSIKSKEGLDYDGSISDIFLVKIAGNSEIHLQVEEVKEFCWVTFQTVKDYVKTPAHLSIFEKTATEFGISTARNKY